jgi:hypothetical protein
MPFVQWQPGDDIECKKGHDLRVVGFYQASTGRWRWCAECQRQRKQLQTSIFRAHKPVDTPVVTQSSVLRNNGAQVDRETLNIFGWAFRGQDYEIETTEPDPPETAAPTTNQPDETPYGIDPQVWQVYLQERRHQQFNAQVRARGDGVKSVTDHKFDYLGEDSDN